MVRRRRRQAHQLVNSPKERAENIMVVDMLRNDLGRIAVPGSVGVPSLCDLEQHPTVWQMSSTVRATTTEPIGLRDIFGALFPCASVTGAPKVSAMSVISDLEESPRGVYCGAVDSSARHHPAPRWDLPPALPWPSGQRFSIRPTGPRPMARAAASPGIRRPPESGRRCSSRRAPWRDRHAGLVGRRADRDHGLRPGRRAWRDHPPPPRSPGPARAPRRSTSDCACRPTPSSCSTTPSKG